MHTLRPLLALSLLAALALPAAAQSAGSAPPASAPPRADKPAPASAPPPSAPAAAPQAGTKGAAATQEAPATKGATAKGAAAAQNGAAQNAAAPDDEDATPARAPDPTLLGRPSPPALHLGAFSSMLAARLGADGALDTGAGVVQLLDGETGQPLRPATLEYGKGPELWCDWNHTFGDVGLSVRMLALGTKRNGDERTKALVHMILTNRTDAAHTVKLGARILPGGGDPEHRPLPSIPFRPGAVFAREGDLVTRDGAVLLTWSGQDPDQVQILPSPANADAPGALLSWTLEMPPQTARYLDLFVAGPHASGAVDESSWREGIAHWSYAQVEEQLIWQSRFRGYYADFQGGDAPLRRAMIGSVHMLRMLGDADREFREFTDRPYGHPATDVAIPAEALGLAAEWSWGENAVPYIRTLLADAVARAQGLSASRRVAFVHGLARAVRVGVDAGLAQQLATAIRALVTESCEVEPWFDPADVRADLTAILDWAGPAADGSGAGYALPELRWASTTTGPVEATMLAMRHALSSGDNAAAWAACQTLLAGTTVNGFGTTSADGEPDGLFALGFMALVRPLFIEDHGDELHVFPHVPEELVPFPGALDLATLATHFGLMSAECHFVGAAHGTEGVNLRMEINRPFSRIVVHTPFDVHAELVKGTVGGTATLLPDGTVECAQDPLNQKGVRFNIKLARE